MTKTAFRSSIGRRVDPGYPTNRAVLLLLPVAGMIGTALSLTNHESLPHILGAAVSTAGAAFIGWALARELSPDDEYAAFGSMALAVAVSLAVPHTSVMLPLVTMMLCRLVNRSVGLPPTALDSVAVFVLGGIVAYAAHSPAIAGLMAIAYALDALIAPPLRRQGIFAAASVLLGIVLSMTRGGSFSYIPGNVRWLLVVIAAMYLAVVMATRRIHSTDDSAAAPLSLVRVRAAMRLGLLAASTGFLPGLHALERSALIWAVLIGVAAGRALSLTRTPSPQSS